MYLRAILRERLEAEPFEPFRIRYLPDESIDVSDAQEIAILEGSVYHLPKSEDWAYIPYAAITSVENVMQDFQGGSPPVPSDAPDYKPDNRDPSA